MYGWRARIGLIVPSTNTVMEGDFWRLAPPGVSIQTARMHHDLTIPPRERLARMATHARQAVIDLVTARVDAIVYGCTSGSFFFGRAWDAQHTAELAELAGRPIVSTSTATVEALQALGLRRVCVVTPYGADVNVQLPPYLAEHGIDVLSLEGLEGAGKVRPADMTPELVFKLVHQTWRPEADGLFFSCTGVPILDLLAPLEEDLGRPVVSANQASFWAALRRVGIAARPRGFGRLLEGPTTDDRRPTTDG